LFAFVVLRLVSSVLCQEIGWEEHLRNNLFSIGWDVKAYSISQSIKYTCTEIIAYWQSFIHPLCGFKLSVHIK